MKHTASYIILLTFTLLLSNSASADSTQLQEIEIQGPSDWEILVIDQSTSSPNGNETFSDGDFFLSNIRKPIDVNFVLGFAKGYGILLNGRFGKLSQPL